jgi:UDP:flavonoid glycosyltransferase YjiC (YdhE family)
LIVYYISGHGFGHASRSIELMRALVHRQPDLRITVKTTAPSWLFDNVPGATYEQSEVDVGLTQTDSVTIDVADSAVRAARFYRDFDRRADSEAAWMRTVDAGLVLGDVPPLAHAAAARAGLASVAISNFTWDWIYEAYGAFDYEAPGTLQTIRDAYRHCTLGLRLPMHGGFATFPRVTDIPFIARRSTRSRTETRRLMGVPADRPFVLASFSGYGLDVPFDRIAADENLTIVASATAPRSPLSYEDLVAAADLVISKPGYGIVSECVANGTPFLYTSRGRFAEYDVFVAEMPRVLRCRFIPQDDLRAGRWREHVDALLAQPDPPERARVDGADVAAELILTDDDHR